jgi:glycosyltransferase involved in cell wall biosynthesis
MRILILTALYPPLGYSGHDERCRQVAEALSRRGHRIQVLTSNHRKPPMGGVDEVGVFRQLFLHDRVNDGGVLGTCYRETFDYERSNARTLYERMDHFKPEVVYVWNQTGLSKSLLFSLQAQEIPMVYDLHSFWLGECSFESDPWYYWWRQNKSLRSSFYRVCLNLIGRPRRGLRQIPIGEPVDLDLSNAYVCSRSLRDELVAAGVPRAESLPIIVPALNSNNILSKIDYQPVRKFMWAGRLSRGKAPELALEAVGILKRRGTRVSLDYFGLGDPSERKAMRERIDSSGLSDCVRMLGIRPGELAQYYQAYDALLFTSRCKDPFPMTPQEAILSGLPCVLSKDGGIQEVVKDGEAAILYEADNATALADAMVRMMDLPDGGGALANRGRQSLQTNHSFDKVVDRLESILVGALHTKD